MTNCKVLVKMTVLVDWFVRDTQTRNFSIVEIEKAFDFAGSVECRAEVANDLRFWRDCAFVFDAKAQVRKEDCRAEYGTVLVLNRVVQVESAS